MYPALEPVTHMSLVTCGKSPSLILAIFFQLPHPPLKYMGHGCFSPEPPCHGFHLLRRKYDTLWPQQALAIGQSPLTCTQEPSGFVSHPLPHHMLSLFPPATLLSRLQ